MLDKIFENCKIKKRKIKNRGARQPTEAVHVQLIPITKTARFGSI